MAAPQPDSMRGPSLKSPLLLLLLLSALTRTGRPGRCFFCSVHQMRTWEFLVFSFSSAQSVRKEIHRNVNRFASSAIILRKLNLLTSSLSCVSNTRDGTKWISICLFKQLNFYFFSKVFCQNFVLKLKPHCSDFLNCRETGRVFVSQSEVLVNMTKHCQEQIAQHNGTLHLLLTTQ